MAGLSQPMPFGEIKIIPIFGTVSKFRIFQNLSLLPVAAQTWQALLPTAWLSPVSSENGELTDPINKAMVSGNIFEIMKKVEGLKSEVKQYGQFIIPKLIVHDLRVVGQN